MKQRASVERARDLRASQSEAERIFWSRVRGRRLGGWKVRRQVPIGPYIVDFYVDEINAVIELDGGQHSEDTHLEKDQKRDRWFEQEGYTVIRIWNMYIYTGLDETLDYVLSKLDKLQAEKIA